MDALNAESFPIYAKLHGDFRYRSIKNLAQDLAENDAEIQRCFLAATNRYGLIVNGYSGRDANVMRMFRQALEQPNAFPQGLFWTTTSASEVLPAVRDLITDARARGIQASIEEVGTFDMLLGKIWRQVPNKPDVLSAHVRADRDMKVAIPLPAPGERYPILRTNALPVVDLPTSCGQLVHSPAISLDTYRASLDGKKLEAASIFDGTVLFWGASEQFTRLFPAPHQQSVETHQIADPVESITKSTVMRSLMEHALARALCEGRPLILRKKDRTYFAVVNHHLAKDPRLRPLQTALGYKGQPGQLTGRVTGHQTATWAEAVSIRLDVREGSVWLLLRPDIWISPLSTREDAGVFLRQRKLRRYNRQSYEILDAWIRVMFSSASPTVDTTVSAFAETDFPAHFRLNTRTAFSRRASPPNAS